LRSTQGDEYRAFGLVDGLVDGLVAAGASVEVPAAGLTIGQQLAFYKQAHGSAVTSPQITIDQIESIGPFK
jgi:hypothetical protein